MAHFEIHLPHIYIEEMIREDFFDMKYHHYHSSYEIYYLIEGERYYFIDRRVFHAASGSLVFIDKNRIHKTSPITAPYHHRLLFQIDNVCMDHWNTSFTAPVFRDLFEDECSVIPLSPDLQKQLQSKLDEIKQEASAKESSFENMIETLVWQILLLAYRAKLSGRRLTSAAISGFSSDPDVSSLKEDRIQTVSQVADYLAAHYAENNSLDEIANRFYINKYYLSRIFRQVTGVTMREYLHIQRIQRAMEFLKNTLDPITEIAHAAGFENVSYFEKIFRRYSGMTPREYRRQHEH